MVASPNCSAVPLLKDATTLPGKVAVPKLEVVDRTGAWGVQEPRGSVPNTAPSVCLPSGATMTRGVAAEEPTRRVRTRVDPGGAAASAACVSAATWALTALSRYLLGSSPPCVNLATSPTTNRSDGSEPPWGPRTNTGTQQEGAAGGAMACCTASQPAAAAGEEVPYMRLGWGGEGLLGYRPQIPGRPAWSATTSEHHLESFPYPPNPTRGPPPPRTPPPPPPPTRGYHRCRRR